MRLSKEIRDLKELLEINDDLFMAVAKLIKKMDELNSAGNRAMPFQEKTQIIEIVYGLAPVLSKKLVQSFLDIGYSKKNAIDKTNSLITSPLTK